MKFKVFTRKLITSRIPDLFIYKLNQYSNLHSHFELHCSNPFDFKQAFKADTAIPSLNKQNRYCRYVYQLSVNKT